MSELYMMVSVLNKYKVKKISEFYGQQGISVIMWMMARGTAAGEILDYFGLEESTKVVLISLVTCESGTFDDLRVCEFIFFKLFCDFHFY